MGEMLTNCIEWFLKVFANVCDTFYNLLNATVDLSIVGLPNDTNLITVLLGGGLITLIIYKLVQWIAPIV